MIYLQDLEQNIKNTEDWLDTWNHVQAELDKLEQDEANFWPELSQEAKELLDITEQLRKIKVGNDV